MNTEKTIESYREEFPVTSKYIFMDNASVAPLSLRASMAIAKFIEENYLLGPSRGDVWNGRLDEVRNAAATLIGAQAHEIAFVPNTSTGINHIAHGLSWHEGNNVVTFSGEFPANVYPWMNLDDQGVELKLVPEGKTGIGPKELTDYVDNGTRLLSVSSVEFLSGIRNDLEGLGKFCRDKGIMFFVDGIQSLGAFPMDVERYNIDFLAADSHKWLLGPEGAGIFYISEANLDRVKTTYVGWKSVDNALEFLPYDFNLRKDAARFEPGSLNLMDIFAMGASISLLLEVGIERISRRIIALTDKLIAGLEERGWELINFRDKESVKSGIVTFKGNIEVAETAGRLAKKGIIIGNRLGHIRVSPHFYNSFEEIEIFLEAIGSNPS